MDIEMNETKREDVTVVIPAKNEESNIRYCLQAVAGQKTNAKVGIIVIDSGSTDRTVEIVREFAGVRLHRIPAEEFAHGKTRNLGASLAQGDVIVFLNADAVPVDERWLDELLLPLAQDPGIAGSYSRHVPLDDCYLYMKRDLNRSMPPEERVRDEDMLLDFMQFSTVSGAIRKDVWLLFPFDDDIAIAEDQDWARRVLDNGYNIAYASHSLVVHSHNYTNRQLYRIKYSVGLSFHRFDTRSGALIGGFVLAIGGFIVKACGDMWYIWKSGVNTKEKIRQMGIALGARAATFWGKYRGWNRRRTG